MRAYRLYGLFIVASAALVAGKTMIPVTWSKSDNPCWIDESLHMLNISMAVERAEGLFPTFSHTVMFQAKVLRAVTSGTATFSITVAPEDTKGADVAVCEGGRCADKSALGSTASVESPLGSLKLWPKEYFARLDVSGYTPDFQGLRILSCPMDLRWTVPSSLVAKEGETDLVAPTADNVLCCRCVKGTDMGADKVFFSVSDKPTSGNDACNSCCQGVTSPTESTYNSGDELTHGQCGSGMPTQNCMLAKQPASSLEAIHV